MAILRDGRSDVNRELKEMFGKVDMLKEKNIIDGNFVPDIKDHLFEQDKSDGIGLDLVALNIQRGRDHGIPGYIHYRRICRSGPSNTFDDLKSNISPKSVEDLKKAYESVEDIDLFIGMSLETPSQHGAMAGNTFLCLIADQFARLKWGDRFFYDLSNQVGSFTPDQLYEIRKASLARLVCDNSRDIDKIQPLALKVEDKKWNPLLSCRNEFTFFGIPTVNLFAWRVPIRG